MKENEKNGFEDVLYFNQTEQFYKNINLFTDTILFEYSYLNKKLYLSPNAKGQLEKSAFLCFFAKLKKSAPQKGEVRIEEICLGKKGEPYHWFSCQVVSLWDEGLKNPVKLVGKLQDITGEKAREKKLLQQSVKDGLTGVYNKTAFEYKIEEKLKKGSQGSLCMIDIDNFKEINDSFGHPTGDRILSQVGRILCNIYKNSDLIGRVGGDEFVIFTSNEHAKEQAERLLSMVENIASREFCCLSVSVGIVPSSENDNQDYQSLFLKADRAMYHAKQSGKNQIAFFNKTYMMLNENNTNDNWLQ